MAAASPVAMEIDTAELRTATAASPAIQQRLSTWTPSPATGRGAEIKQESASSRRQELFGAKAETLAKHNDTVALVAEQQKLRTLTDTTNAKTAVFAKTSKAEENRAAALASTVEGARTHTAHAKEVAAEVEARRKLEAEVAKEAPRAESFLHTTH